MSLIKSISGIRGTIGGSIGDNLTTIDIVECAAGYGHYILNGDHGKKIVIGRDGRISGDMVKQLVVQTLISMGLDVIDLDLSTTPTVEMCVPALGAAGGIIVTASHNPKHWNALKFLNHSGEFISAEIGESILQSIAERSMQFASVDALGSYSKAAYFEEHVQSILDLDLVDVERIKSKKFNVVVDCINSTGALAIPLLLDKLGVTYKLLNAEITGDFAHNPEPLQAHLTELSEAVIENKADLGIAVDPDVDRLAFMMEDGIMFGEEYTLVAVADYILSHKPGSTVTNLSSTLALRDITQKHGQTYHAAAVGEVNVVKQMKAVHAVIGGEGNGGVILPELHYGRDALVGIALMLSHLAECGQTMTAIKKALPQYEMVKSKIELTPDLPVDQILAHMAQKFKDEETITIDGVKIIFDKEWVHLRKSNTEPIIRIYAESQTTDKANNLVEMIRTEISNFVQDN